MAIRRQRLKRGLSQADLAEKVGSHRFYISQLERAVRRPSLRMLTAIAKALGVPASELLK